MEEMDMKWSSLKNKDAVMTKMHRQQSMAHITNYLVFFEW